MTPEAAIAELMSGAGRIYDAQVVHALQHVTGLKARTGDASGVTAEDAVLLSQVS
jgi:HD-GYP domain-containing protein (c-di-GMP phosphodiesterase class II)